MDGVLALDVPPHAPAVGFDPPGGAADPTVPLEIDL